ncbi:MAG: ABC transporter permease [Nocardioidaceae bacterium]
MNTPVRTFSPRPGAAPLPRMIWAQARMETKLILRNGEQLLIAVVIPLIALVAGVHVYDSLDRPLRSSPVDTLAPGVFALAVMSTSFTSLAIATGFERRYGVLKRLGSSPLPRAGLLAGKVLALFVVEVVQLAVIAAVAFALGWGPNWGMPGVLGLIASVLLGTAAFASLGLLVAGTLRAEATLAVANLVYLLLMVGGAVVLPISEYGAWGNVAQLLPSGALGEAIRDSLIDATFPASHLLVLVVWAVVGTFLTTRTFRWE